MFGWHQLKASYNNALCMTKLLQFNAYSMRTGATHPIIILYATINIDDTINCDEYMVVNVLRHAGSN